MTPCDIMKGHKTNVRRVCQSIKSNSEETMNVVTTVSFITRGGDHNRTRNSNIA